MKTYSFAYGSGTVELPLDEKNVIGELHGNAVAPLADIRAALWASLDAPIDSAPLCERAKAGDTVALVVSDMTRFWMRQDLVVPHLVDYLAERCGVREEDITIVIANGTHIGGDEQELRTLVTDAVYDRVKVKNHDCEAKDLVYLGTTPHGTPVSIDRTAAEADLVVCLGAVTHHVMAGFGGGRKSILPGISGRETIFHNHAFSLDAAQLRSNPAIGNGVLKGNPLHEDMCEAAGLVKNLFIVNLVMNAQMQLAAILSGHYLTSWEAACRMVDRIYQVDVPEKADVIVAAAAASRRTSRSTRAPRPSTTSNPASSRAARSSSSSRRARAAAPPNTSTGRRTSSPAPSSNGCASISPSQATFSSSTASRRSATTSCSIRALPRRTLRPWA